MNLTLDKAKILVVGDSGVGKTSLVHLICYHEILKKPSWTIGCSVDVKLHQFKDGTVNQKTYFIEFWDVGGSTSCRKIFYSGVDGIILTHDLTNRRSQENLKKWLNEISDDKLNSIAIGFPTTNDCQYLWDNNSPPAIVIGTKLEDAQQVRDLSTLRASSSIALECRLDEINLDCLQTKYLSPGSSNSVKLAKFFDKAIEYRIRQSSNEISSKKSNKTNDTKSSYGVYHVE